MRWYYQKFGSNEPEQLYAEKVYNKMGRREEYLKEADELRNNRLFGDESEIAKAICIVYAEEQQKKEIHQALMQALEDFKKIDIVGYELVTEFYLGEKEVALTEMAKKYGISVQAYSQKLKRHLKILRMIFFSCINEQ